MDEIKTPQEEREDREKEKKRQRDHYWSNSKRRKDQSDRHEPSFSSMVDKWLKSQTGGVKGWKWEGPSLGISNESLVPFREWLVERENAERSDRS